MGTAAQISREEQKPFPRVKLGDEVVLGGLRFATIGLLQRLQEPFLDGFTGVQERVSAGWKFRVSSMKLTCLDNF